MPAWLIATVRMCRWAQLHSDRGQRSCVAHHQVAIRRREACKCLAVLGQCRAVGSHNYNTPAVDTAAFATAEVNAVWIVDRVEMCWSIAEGAACRHNAVPVARLMAGSRVLATDKSLTADLVRSSAKTPRHKSRGALAARSSRS